MPMKIDLQSGEVILKEGSANLQKGWETVGGKLYLTNFRLIFKTHKLNIQSGITEIERSKIQNCKKCWTKFLNLIPLAPNSLAVRTIDGEEYRFVLYKRKTWIKEIESMRGTIHSSL